MKLMVVDDFDFRGSVVRHHETDPILAIDADRVLSFAVVDQRFQLVSRRKTKIINRRRYDHEREFALSVTMEVLWERLASSLRGGSVEEIGRWPAAFAVASSAKNTRYFT